MAASDLRCIVVGCGLSGAVAARLLAEAGCKVEIWERRDHIAGNMYDYVDEHGILVHRYGPHTFHTKDRALYEFVCRFEEWEPYRLTCGAVLDGTYTPTPFNYTTIDTFFPKEKAERLKQKLSDFYRGRESAPVLEVMNCPDPEIREYADFLFEKDYRPYTAKQWGVPPEEIDPSVLRRVPLRFSYETGYFDDPFQVMPKHSYQRFFANLLDHPGITVRLNTDALERLAVREGKLFIDGKASGRTFAVYTGAIDELFSCVYGKLPYRSLRFVWGYEERDSIQDAPVVAYPQAEGYTRITEYNKLPVQNTGGSSFAVEYPLPYVRGENNEPYYPVLTEKSNQQFGLYRSLAERVPNLFCCGRLADFKYYNMDEALQNAIRTSLQIKKKLL